MSARLDSLEPEEISLNSVSDDTYEKDVLYVQNYGLSDLDISTGALLTHNKNILRVDPDENLNSITYIRKFVNQYNTNKTVEEKFTLFYNSSTGIAQIRYKESSMNFGVSEANAAISPYTERMAAILPKPVKISNENKAFEIFIKYLEDTEQSFLNKVQFLLDYHSALDYLNSNKKISINKKGKNEDRFDSEIIAWTKYWNNKILYGKRGTENKSFYDFKTLIPAPVVKGMFGVESSFRTNPRLNGLNDIMQSLVPGDDSLWVLARVNPNEIGLERYKNGKKLIFTNGLVRDETDPPILEDDINKMSMHVYPYFSGFEDSKKMFGDIFELGMGLVKNSKLLKLRTYPTNLPLYAWKENKVGIEKEFFNLPENSSTEGYSEPYYFDASAVTPRMSVAIAVGKLAYKINTSAFGGGALFLGIQAYNTMIAKPNPKMPYPYLNDVGVKLRGLSYTNEEIAKLMNYTLDKVKQFIQR
jgi:hypothetical protein